ncbi:MAG: NAD(P)H-binding protein [Dehalococcoidia bacterium]
MKNPEKILVTGGTGKTGRRVAQRLSALGHPVRIGSRSGETPFDWTDQATWAPALRNVGAVYLTYYPDLAIPGAVDTVGSFIELAMARGIRRLVLLSGRGEEEAQRAEQVLQDSRADWAILRCSMFSQNFSEYWLRYPVVRGEVVLPVGDVEEPFLDADDIADVAVAALTDDRHVGQLYELTGPRLLTFPAAVEEIAKAVGRDIRYMRVSADQYASALEAELPPEFVWLVKYIFTNVLDGRNAYLTDGVQRALGREPRDFADYARNAASSGVWDA